jgi:hypothetical protein
MNNQTKKVTLVQEPVTLANGNTFTGVPVKTSSDVLRVSLLMLMKHVSDVHVTVMEIIAEKFGHSVEDLHNAIVEDPRWEKILQDPLITDLTETAIAHSQKPKRKNPIKISTEPELVFD